MGSFSLIHWIIVLAVVLLLFGPKRLPDLARGVGEAIREFKKAVSNPDQHQAANRQLNQTPDQLTPPATPVTTQPQNTSSPTSTHNS